MTDGEKKEKKDLIVLASKYIKKRSSHDIT